MSLLPPLGEANPQLRDALKKLSATKYGKPRAQVEQEFFKRMGAGDEAKKQKMEALKKAQEERMAAFRAGGPAGVGANTSAGTPGAPAGPARPQVVPMGPPQPPSFLDEWLSKRQQILDTQKAAPVKPQPVATPNPAFGPVTPAPAPASAPAPAAPVQDVPRPAPAPKPVVLKPQPQPQAPPAPVQPEKLHIRDASANPHDDGVSVKLR